MNVRDHFLALWKTFVVTATGLIFAWIANHGIHLSDATTSAITVLLISAGLALYNSLVNWLLSRTGDGAPAKALRALGKLLSLGGKPPTYAPAAVTK